MILVAPQFEDFDAAIFKVDAVGGEQIQHVRIGFFLGFEDA